MSRYKSAPDACPRWMTPASPYYKSSEVPLPLDSEDLLNEAGAVRISALSREHGLTYRALTDIARRAEIAFQRVGGAVAVDEKAMLQAIAVHGRPEGALSKRALARGARCSPEVLASLVVKLKVVPVRTVGDMEFYSPDDLKRVRAEIVRLKDADRQYRVIRVSNSRKAQKRDRKDRSSAKYGIVKAVDESLEERRKASDERALKMQAERVERRRRIKGTVPPGMSPIDYARVLRDEAHEARQGVEVMGCLPLKALCRKFDVSYHTACLWRKQSILEGFTTERLTYVLVSCFEKKAAGLHAKKGAVHE